LSRKARELAAKAKEIEDAVYDLKAVNPHKKPVLDTRTPEELMDIIEAKGREIAEALERLRTASKPRSSGAGNLTVVAAEPHESLVRTASLD
jgi:hypothetical protein